MFKIPKIILIAAIICLAFGFAQPASAEEPAAADDTAITGQEPAAQDLEVSDPVLLPGNAFYFLKEWARNIKITFTFDAVKKAELKNKFSNEKLIELKKLSDSGASFKIIKKATENYKKAVEKIKEQADKIKDTAEQNADVNKFLEKFTNQQVLHEKILQKLEGQVPEEVFAKIKEAREQHLEKFKEVMTKLQENKDKMVEKIKNAVDDDADVLDNIKKGMPQEIKDKLTELKAKILERKQNQKLCTMEYAPVCGADGKTYSNKCMAESAGVKAAYQGECNVEKTCTADSDCPTIYCIKAPCPVNKCVEGKCKLTEAEDQDNPVGCKNLWWFDNTHKVCAQRKFCGAYMYFGLQTFPTKNKCVAALNKIQCWADNDCLQPNCGPSGANCIGAVSKCVNHKCQTMDDSTNGTLNGKVSIGPLCPVEPCPASTPNPYTGRKITLSRPDGEIIKIALNSDGTFESDIPSDTYTVGLTDCTYLGCSTALPKTVEVKKGETSQVNIDIDTGIR